MATVAQGDRYLTVQGPIKVEYMRVTAITTADTVTTNMARPLFAAAIDNTGAVSVNTSTSVSGKTITITNSSYAGVGVCILIVIGF